MFKKNDHIKAKINNIDDKKKADFLVIFLLTIGLFGLLNLSASTSKTSLNMLVPPRTKIIVMMNNESVPISMEIDKLKLEAKILMKTRGAPPINHVSGLIDL
jgi:hypothetical protein